LRRGKSREVSTRKRFDGPKGLRVSRGHELWHNPEFRGRDSLRAVRFANLYSDRPHKVESGAQEKEDLRLWKVEVSMWWVVMGTN